MLRSILVSRLALAAFLAALGIINNPIFGANVAYAEDNNAGEEAGNSDEKADGECPEAKETVKTSGKVKTTTTYYPACKGTHPAYSEVVREWTAWSGKVDDDLVESDIPSWARADLTSAPCNTSDECDSQWSSLTNPQRKQANSKEKGELVARALKIKVRAVEDDGSYGTVTTPTELWALSGTDLAAIYLRDAKLRDIARLDRDLRQVRYVVEQSPRRVAARAESSANAKARAAARAEAAAAKAREAYDKARAAASDAKVKACPKGCPPPKAPTAPVAPAPEPPKSGSVPL